MVPCTWAPTWPRAGPAAGGCSLPSGPDAVPDLAPHLPQLEERRFLLGSCTEWKHRRQSGRRCLRWTHSIPPWSPLAQPHWSWLCKRLSYYTTALGVEPASCCSLCARVHTRPHLQMHRTPWKEDSGVWWQFSLGNWGHGGAYSSLYCSIVPFGIFVHILITNIQRQFHK